MARRTKAEAERNKMRIMMAALDLFVVNGYERTTFEEVAGRIGLTKGAVYWHFKSKQDLLVELVTFMTARHTEELGRVLSEPVSLNDLRDHFVRRAELIVRKPVNRKFFKMMTHLDWSARRFATVKRRLQQMEDTIFAVIERVLNLSRSRGNIREDVEIDKVKVVLGSMWLGLVKIKTDECLETRVDETVALGFDLVLDGIRSRG